MNDATRPPAEGPQIFDDAGIRALLDAPSALTWAREALVRHANGDLTAPPRSRFDLGNGHLVVTAGRSGDDWYGYRCYDTVPTVHDEQVVVAHDARTGRIIAIAWGTELGILRTGALGGVAAEALTGGSIRHLAVIGTGRQAWAQVWAINGFTRPEHVTVHSREATRREQFAHRASSVLGLTVTSCDTARDAVAGADMVILATNSPTPVIDTDWLESDVAVTTMGPKQVGRAEFPPDLVTGAAFAVTDSIDQLRSYHPPALVADAGGMRGLGDLLGDLPVGRHTAPTSGRRVYCSVGLAGSEVHILGRLAQRSATGDALPTDGTTRAGW